MNRLIIPKKILNLYDLYLYVDKDIRNKSKRTLLIVFLAGILESLVILLIVPFAKEIFNNESSLEVIFVKRISIYLGLSVLMSAFFRILALKATNKHSSLIVNNISKKIFNKLIFQKYRNSKSLSAKEMISRVSFMENMMSGVICPSWAFITNSTIALMIFSVFVFQVGSIAIVGGISTIIIYFSIFSAIKSRISSLDKLQKSNKSEALNIINTTVNGIRDIRVNFQERQLINSYNSNDLPLRKASASINTMAGLPRIILENALFLSIAVYVFIRSSESEYLLIPNLAVLLVVIQRMMPLGQSLYGSTISINSNNYIVESCLNVFNDLPQITKKDYLINKKNNLDIELILENVSYKENGKNILKNVNLKISPKRLIGIYGRSGSGKSTLLDIIAGLIQQTSGSIKFKDKEILFNERISYSSMVSQSSYLFSGSIKYNITFKNNLSKKEELYMRNCCKIANIDSFIEALKDGYEQKVGVSSFTNISGGQKQRICIARALYNSSPILILDEITSSLDQETSRHILNSIKKEFHNRIILLVSHKYDDLTFCDDLYFLNNGKLIPK